jgi:hypothetical protein
MPPTQSQRIKAGLKDRAIMTVAMFLRPLGSLLLAALLAVAALSAPARAQDREMDFDLIYAELQPYGTWFEHPVWGTVWRPRVDAEWRPYAHGSWLYTDDYGWYWQAEEPWGWAPFHYGRWLIDEDGSWIWIADSEWGPAWVAWRWSDDYVGWAPLPPQAAWGADGELAFDPAVLSAPGFLAVWCFVRPHQLILPGVHRFFVARRQAHAIFRSTRALPGPRKYEGRFINTGFDVKRFEHMTGRPVVRLRLRSVDSPQAAERGRGGGPEIAVFKPRFSERAEGGRIHRPAAVDRGPPPAMADPGAAAGRPLAPKSEIPSAAPGQVLRRQDAPLPPTSNPAASADPGSPKTGAPLTGPAGDRRPDFGPPFGHDRPRQQPPAVSGGDGDRGRGPPPGLMHRSYGGPPQGLPRAYNPDGRPPPSLPNRAPPTLHAPAPAAGPAVRGPAPNPQRGPPRKDDSRGPG